MRVYESKHQEELIHGENGKWLSMKLDVSPRRMALDSSEDSRPHAAKFLLLSFFLVSRFVGQLHQCRRGAQ